MHNFSFNRQAMDEYLRLERARQTCFVKCREEKPKVPSDYFSEDELSFFHGVIQRATCIRKCEEDLAGLQPTGGIPQSVQKDFQKREGYNYLQMALYQVRYSSSGIHVCPRGWGVGVEVEEVKVQRERQ